MDEYILINAITNNVQGIKIIDSDAARKIEPNVICKNALWVPSAGIMDSHAIMSKLENLSILNKVSIAYNTEVEDIEFTNKRYKIWLVFKFKKLFYYK